MTRRAFSVAIFARCAGRVLLIKHRRLGTWLPVGGEVEPGETPLEAARRELREETGLTGEFHPLDDLDGSPAGLIGYEEHLAGSKGLHLNFAFRADVATDRVTRNDEFDEHVWVSSTDGIEAPRNVHQLARRALGHTPAELVALAQRWLAAFNAHDLEALLALYADDAAHTSPKLRAREPATKGEVRGKAALRAWFADAMERLPQLRYEPRHLTAMNDRVVMEYVRHNPGDDALVVAEVLRVGAAGTIAESHVHHG